jgi:hypothetical protein
MRVRIALVGVLVILLAAGWMYGQTTSNPITSNPIPAPIEKKGLAVEVKDYVRLPDTRTLRPADQDVAPGQVRDINSERSAGGKSAGGMPCSSART